MYKHIIKTCLPLNTIYNQKNILLLLSLCIPPFCDVLPNDNHDRSEGGAGGEAPLALAKSARKAATSLSKSNKSCPCAA